MVPGAKAGDSMYEARVPTSPGNISEERSLETIRRHDQANPNARAYAHQYRRLSRAYSDAADASMGSKTLVRVGRNK